MFSLDEQSYLSGKGGYSHTYQQTLDEVACVRVKPDGIVRLILDNLLKHGVIVIAVEWRLAEMQREKISNM